MYLVTQLPSWGFPKSQVTFRKVHLALWTIYIEGVDHSVAQSPSVIFDLLRPTRVGQQGFIIPVRRSNARALNNMSTLKIICVQHFRRTSCLVWTNVRTGVDPENSLIIVQQKGDDTVMISVAVLAKISLRSPRKLFYFTIEKNIYRSKVSKTKNDKNDKNYKNIPLAMIQHDTRLSDPLKVEKDGDMS